MRTTIDLDDDVLRMARDLAQERAESLGRVLSDLARQGLQLMPNPKGRIRVIPALPHKPGARPVTMQDVRDLEEAEV